jgi:hypothetical protein
MRSRDELWQGPYEDYRCGAGSMVIDRKGSGHASPNPRRSRAILLHKLKLELPQQPPPRSTTRVPKFPQEAHQL